MIKRLALLRRASPCTALLRSVVALCIVLALCGQTAASGSIQLSLSQQFDAQGRPLSGGLLYFFQAGTTTPQSAFQDTALTIPYPNPIQLDASGRVPSFYLADGLIKIRLTDSTGVTIIAADNLLVIGPSGGGGGGGSVDATTVLATGDVKARYGTGTLTGFVRANGRTIGSATSGGTERANADCQALFEYLWNTDPNLIVPAGRGASSIADWTANKTITLPDLRGRTIAGMDDMGATAASRLTATYFGISATVLGNAGGAEKFSLTADKLAPHTHAGSGTTGSENASFNHNFSLSGTTSGQTADHTHGYTAPTVISVLQGTGAPSNVGLSVTGAATAGTSNDHQHTFAFSGVTGFQNQNHQHAFSFTTDNGTGVVGNPYNTANPKMVMTFYVKL